MTKNVTAAPRSCGLLMRTIAGFPCDARPLAVICPRPTATRMSGGAPKLRHVYSNLATGEHLKTGDGSVKFSREAPGRLAGRTAFVRNPARNRNEVLFEIRLISSVFIAALVAAI